MLIQGCWHWGQGGAPFAGVKMFFQYIIGADEREGVDQKSDKKWHKNEGVQPKKWCLSHKFFYVFFFITQFISFLVSHEVLIILQQATRKTYPRAHQCIWDNWYLTFA